MSDSVWGVQLQGLLLLLLLPRVWVRLGGEGRWRLGLWLLQLQLHVSLPSLMVVHGVAFGGSLRPECSLPQAGQQAAVTALKATLMMC